MSGGCRKQHLLRILTSPPCIKCGLIRLSHISDGCLLRPFYGCLLLPTVAASAMWWDCSLLIARPLRGANGWPIINQYGHIESCFIQICRQVGCLFCLSSWWRCNQIPQSMLPPHYPYIMDCSPSFSSPILLVLCGQAARWNWPLNHRAWGCVIKYHGRAASPVHLTLHNMLLWCLFSTCTRTYHPCCEMPLLIACWTPPDR